jgi:thymidylate synthase
MNTQYEDLLTNVLAIGVQKGDRTGTGTRSLFAQQLRYNLSDGFPLITTKKVHLKSVVHELLWFLSGDTNIKYLVDNGVTIWNEWANAENGELGPVYGAQWRHWNRGYSGWPVDQISEVLKTLKTNPNDRRMIVTAWNPSDVPDQALPPCPVLFQFYVANGRLSCHLYQRSCDLFLGVPFNIASYSLLVHMVAQQTDLIPGEFIWTGGDCHIYNNHLEQVKQQIGRHVYAFPQLHLHKASSIFDYKYEDVTVIGYNHHPAISAPVAI